MKNTIIFFALLIGLQFSNAQDFQESKKYSIKANLKTKNQEYDNYTFDLIKSNDNSKKVTTFTINEIDLFEDVFISTLENPGLDGVSEIIKVEIEYIACCANVETYYLLVTEENNIISLPQLDNVYCENTDTVLQYNFPNQEHGALGSIVKNEVLYTDLGEIESVTRIQKFTWYDDDFGPINSLANKEH